MYHLLTCNLTYKRRDVRKLYEQIGANVLINPQTLRDLFGSSMDDNDIVDELASKMLALRDTILNEDAIKKKHINFIADKFTYQIMSDIIIESLKKVKDELKEPISINLYVDNVDTAVETL